MKSFDYFATFDESVSILEELCQEGLRVVAQPGLFDEPRAPVFEHVTPELVELLRTAPALFLSGSFSRFDVPFTQLKSGPSAGKFMIDMMGQGPLLQGLLARCNEVNGVQLLLPGQYAYQDSYRNPETMAWERPGADVKGALHKVVTILKKRCTRHLLGPGIFIGPRALAQLQSGQAVIRESHITTPAKA